ncbi:hypothetical protein GDO81_011275 [Engystomops pustulosus]|uniref:Uncharacterized protein n=1 Tax=Engystomops pustulosus TaxID=76066 RepID=A0AAV7BD92_ENGPU|nr:hypothetical protein GDO81_011275 [Engystomops pustulosus]
MWMKRRRSDAGPNGEDTEQLQSGDRSPAGTRWNKVLISHEFSVVFGRVPFEGVYVQEWSLLKIQYICILDLLQP